MYNFFHITHIFHLLFLVTCCYFTHGCNVVIHNCYRMSFIDSSSHAFWFKLFVLCVYLIIICHIFISILAFFAVSYYNLLLLDQNLPSVIIKISSPLTLHECFGSCGMQWAQREKRVCLYLNVSSTRVGSQQSRLVVCVCKSGSWRAFSRDFSCFFWLFCEMFHYWLSILHSYEMNACEMHVCFRSSWSELLWSVCVCVCSQVSCPYSEMNLNKEGLLPDRLSGERPLTLSGPHPRGRRPDPHAITPTQTPTTPEQPEGADNSQNNRWSWLVLSVCRRTAWKYFESHQHSQERCCRCYCIQLCPAVCMLKWAFLCC